MSNNLPANAAIPLASINKNTREFRDSISRISTGLKVLGGNDAASHAMGAILNADGQSYKTVSSNAQQGIDLLLLAESALLELNALTTRLRELGVADDLSTNTTSDTASLDAEATAVSDTIDSIVSSLVFNGLAVLGTSAKTFNVNSNIATSSNTQTVKTTVGIAATNITDASGTENSADTTLGEITQSLGHVAGGLGSLRGYQHVAEASSATLIQAASHLQDTNIAAETAKATKNQIIKNYALAMVAHANNEEMEKLKVLA